jgi:hypothetical protein
MHPAPEQTTMPGKLHNLQSGVQYVLNDTSQRAESKAEIWKAEMRNGDLLCQERQND